jgi:hypothetical protein
MESLHVLNGRRKALLVLLTVACLTLGTVTGVAAFEPPSDPANKFACEPNPVSGHPGSAGLEGVVFSEKSLAAWSAVFAPNGSAITLCGE